MPSIEKTVTLKERERFAVELVLGVDSDDNFWTTISNRNEVVKKCIFTVTFVSVRRADTLRIPFNEATRAAYNRGAAFIVRINDDTEFISPGWISMGVEVLFKYNPPFVGVVGPTCKEGNRKILTHDMVHVTHFNIFTDYYPPELNNWWVDDWISRVYGSSRTKKLSSWKVKHHTQRYIRRYSVDQTQEDLLPQLLDRGEKQVFNFLQTYMRELQ